MAPCAIGKFYVGFTSRPHKSAALPPNLSFFRHGFPAPLPTAPRLGALAKISVGGSATPCGPPPRGPARATFSCRRLGLHTAPLATGGDQPWRRAPLSPPPPTPAPAPRPSFCAAQGGCASNRTRLALPRVDAGPGARARSLRRVAASCARPPPPPKAPNPMGTPGLPSSPHAPLPTAAAASGRRRAARVWWAASRCLYHFAAPNTRYAPTPACMSANFKPPFELNKQHCQPHSELVIQAEARKLGRASRSTACVHAIPASALPRRPVVAPTGVYT